METPKPKISLDIVAQMAHDAVCTFCISEAISRRTWNEITDADKELSLRAMKSLLDSRVFDPPCLDIASLAEIVWDAWMQSAISLGWKYGPVKDEKKKEHPSIVPDYKTLSTFEKTKDYIYIGIIQSILIGYDIEV